MICLETVSAQYHLHNLEDIFAIYLLFFSGERRERPHFFFSLLGGPVVPSLEQKGYNFFSSCRDSKCRLLLCLYCLLHSQHSLAPAGGFHYLLSKSCLPCFSPLFPFSLQVSSFSFYQDVSLKKKKVVQSFKGLSHSQHREINKRRGRT